MNLNYQRYFLMPLIAALLAFPLQAQVVLPDKQVERSLENELFVNQLVHGDEIDVSVSDAVAVLDGEVSTLYERRMAEQVASRTKGVRAVVNQLHVQPHYMSDEQIKQGVEKAFIENPGTEAYDVRVLVNNGVVQIVGEVQSFAEKKLVDDVAASVRGVKEIQNSVDIEYAADRKDVSLEEDMAGLVKSDVRLEIKDFGVDVDQGVMILEGEVGTAYEKQLLKSHAWTCGAEAVDLSDVTIVTAMTNPDRIKGMMPELEDEEIKTALERAYQYDARIAAYPIEIEVEDGMVYLEGQVANLHEKNIAEQDALNIRGVMSVVNDLELVAADPNAATVDEIRSKIANNALLEGNDVEVRMDGDIAILTGEVESNFLRYVAESVASSVQGVSSVQNDLDTEVYPGYYGQTGEYEISDKSMSLLKEKLPDEMIENDIEYQLLWSPYVDLGDIEVEVINGVAQISGEVSSERERRAVIANAYEGGAIAVESSLYFNQSDG
jgi:osmotically-inducible protein OsmY